MIKNIFGQRYFLSFDNSSSMGNTHLVPPSKIFKQIISLFSLTINILFPFTTGVCVEEISLVHNLLPVFLFTANNFPIALVIITISFLIIGKASISEKAFVVSFTSRSIKLY